MYFKINLSMKNLILSLTLLICAIGANAQSNEGKNPAQLATEKMTQLYSLNDQQQAEMLKIQERKYRNLADIEPLKASDPSAYILKVRSVQSGNNTSIERILDAEQIKVFREQQRQLREKKSSAYKQLQSSGANQQEIEKKMVEYDLQAM
jgi:hypothetical protein